METRISMKNIYLIAIITIGLIGLGVGSTFAMFTAEANIDNPIAFASNLSSTNILAETIEVTVPAEEDKFVDIIISNTSEDDLNYSVWYSPSSNNLEVGSESSDEDYGPVGTLPSSDSFTLTVGLRNSGDTPITVTIGVSSSGSNVILPSGVTQVPNEPLPSKSFYNVLKKLTAEGRFAKKYEGEHQDSMNASESNKDIYYFYAGNAADGNELRNMNNVVFGNQCWQIIRTTDTGGTKLLYNGEPTITVVDGKTKYDCGDNRPAHIGGVKSTLNLSGTYYFADKYTASKSGDTTTFTLINPVSKTITSENASSVIENVAAMYPYTCKKTTAEETCTNNEFYKVIDQSSGTIANVYASVVNRDSLGNNSFNSHYDSVADVGYMYNTRYGTLSTTLVNNTKVSSSDNYLFGDGIVENQDGTFSLTTAQEVHGSSWGTEYSNLNNKYVCMPGYYTYDSSTGTNYCSDSGTSRIGVLRYVTATTTTTFTASSVYKYGYGIQLDNGSYKLIGNNGENDTLQYIYNWANDGSSNCFANNANSISDCGYKTLSKSHYSCFNLTGKCNTYYYIYFSDVSKTNSVSLSDGKYVSTDLTDHNNILYLMLYQNDSNGNVNQEDSVMKTVIEEWYENTLFNNFDQYIEDVIYCNDRTINSIGGWNPNGGETYQNYGIYFKDRFNNSVLSCNNITDRFSVSNSAALLSYKVGLITFPELYLISQNSGRISSGWYYFMSPSYFYDYRTYIRGIYENGDMTSGRIDSKNGIRPAISLVPGIKFSSGNGSMTKPYVVDLNSVTN